MKTVIERPEGLADVVRMAREAGAYKNCDVWQMNAELLERFAALVRADEQMKALESARTIGGDWAVEFEQEYLK